MTDVAGEAHRVRVVVADDDSAVRRVISRIVAANPAFELVGQATDAEEAVQVCSGTRPDVALIDVGMPLGGGLRAAEGIRDCSPATKVMALSGASDRDRVMLMLSAGAVGYVVKGPDLDIPAVIVAASRGQGVLSNEVAASVIDRLGGQLATERTEAQNRQESARNIRRAINGDGLTMAFQPIIDLRRSKLAGFEALARFAMVPNRTPDLWFAEAWALGLGAELEAAAMAQALEIGGRSKGGVDQLLLSVNLSPLAVTNGRFGDFFSEIMDCHGLVLELTEHALVDDYDLLAESLRVSRDRGVQVAVDDAGAGYASLRHILRVTPDLIKLDASLVEGVDADRAKRALATSLITFAHEIGIKVIAEGIETASQLRSVTDLGADLGQGYFLGRPAPFGQVRSCA